MNVTLRQWTEEDRYLLVEYANNKHIADNLTDAFPHPYTMEDAVEYIKKASREKPTRIFAVDYEGAVVGSIGIFPDTDIYRTNAAVAYWIAEPYWRKGIATEAIRKIVEYGFRTFGITRAYAKPFGNNIASQKALEKAGFTVEGHFKNTIVKNEEFIDEIVYAYRR